MQYRSKYQSPLGEIMIAADENDIIGLWFVGQKYFAFNLDKENEEKDVEIIKCAKKWLDIYFSGKNPDFELPLKFIGTNFQKEVWKVISMVPYGKVITYNDIAKKISKEMAVKRMSARAVGKAVGHNPISIIVPCHRVIASNGSLTGYAGGIERKKFLLELENVDMNNIYMEK